MNKRRNTGVLSYVIAGSAVGGAVAYLFTTESGRKVRRSITHPDELAENVENARTFVETRAKIVSGRVRTLLNRTKEGVEAGQKAYQEAEQTYLTGLRQRVEGKGDEIASNVHKAVDNVNRTAHTFEQTVLEPFYEMVAIYRGVDRGIRTVFGRKRTIQPVYSDQG